MENPNIEEKVLAQIETGQMKPRSKYIFSAQKIGVLSGLTIIIFSAILFCSLLLFYWRASDNLGYLRFGRSGIGAFLESFPYILILSVAGLIISAGYLFYKTEQGYKKSVAVITMSVIILVGLGGTVLALSHVADKIEETAAKEYRPGKFLRPFFRPALDQPKWGVAGRIIQIDDKFLMIETPHGTSTLDIRQISLPSSSLMLGQFVVAVGERQGSQFSATQIRIMPGEEIELVRRNVHRRFGPGPMGKMK